MILANSQFGLKNMMFMAVHDNGDWLNNLLALYDYGYHVMKGWVQFELEMSFGDELSYSLMELYLSNM